MLYYNNRNYLVNNTMSTSENNPCNNHDFPSIFSSSSYHEQVAFRNQLSLKYLYEDEHIYLDLSRVNSFKSDEKSFKRCHSSNYDLQLKRYTSFQNTLIENHRNVLIQSIKDYFAKINHDIIKKVKIIDLKNHHCSTQENNLLDQEISMENTIKENPLISNQLKDKLIDTLRKNINQVIIAQQTISLCPKQIAFQVLFLIGIIFMECESLVQHFKSKRISKQIKEKSSQLARKLKDEACLSQIMPQINQSSSQIFYHFQTLVEKWMLTLFLMKIGVFENELQSKSIEECLGSQTLKEISLNDLLNQHLIHPGKKIKQQ